MRRARSQSGKNASVAAALAVVAAGVIAGVSGCGTHEPASAPATAAAKTTLPPDNAERSAYAGTESCAACHADLVRTFVHSPMHRMTRPLGAAHPETEVHAPFAGRDTTFSFHHDQAIAETEGSERFLRVLDGLTHTTRRYRLTKIIGGRVREDFVGVDLAELAANGATEERVLPVSWLIDEKRWRYKGYSVMSPDRPRLEAGAIWRTTCIACHNTLTAADAELGGIVGKRLSTPAPWPDRLLPSDERRTAVTTDAAWLETWTRSATKEVGTFAEPSLVELGIGCEACHGGARAHAEDPSVKPSLVTSGAPYKWNDPRIARGADAHATEVNRACSRCHQVLFTAYPWTWEGGARLKNPGGSSTTSGEARDFLLSKCSLQMDCTGCHDPHGGTTRAAEDALATPAGNGHCTTCHQAYASDDALRAHAHHDPRGAGGACVACHLPKKNMGLDGKLTRYHRIGSPSDSDRVLFDRPLECATCHPRATTRSLVETMETWFRRRYERAPLEALYGDLDRPVLDATLERGKPHEKAVAIELLGEARVKSALPAILREATEPDVEPYPIVRDYARLAAVKIDASVSLPPRDTNEAAATKATPEED